MPNYEYKCTKDGSKFELWQEVGSEAPPCPTCGEPSKKVFGPPRVHFKGSGFYLTDLRAEQSGAKGGDKSGDKSGDKADSAADSAVKTDAQTETKSETKTDAKTETKSDNKAGSAPVSSPSASPSSGATGTTK